MSALALWHPAGAAASTLRVGEPSADAGGALDVAVVAPGGRTLRDCDEAVAAAARRLAPGGIVWIVAPRRARGRAERAARRAGLIVVDRVLMAPAWPAAAHLVPLAPAAVRDAGVRHLGLSPRRAHVLALLCRARPTRLALARAAPSCAVVLARPPAPARFAWLGAVDGAGVRAATVSTGPRRDAQVAVALRFGGSPAPDLAVKVALDAGGLRRLESERVALGRLGAAATAAGAAVALPRAGSDPALLVADALPGRPASSLLARWPERLDDVLGAVGDWLLAWNRATAVSLPATAALLERLLVAPAEHVAAARPALASYAGAMRALAARLRGAPLVGVAVHDDLTMSNVLLGPRGLAIVDWEAASPDGLALTDLWYALADGLARARRVAHARAVELLVAGGPPAAALARLPAAHAAALGVARDQALLGFHACWLGHADDELRRGAPGAFVAVVETLAAHGREPA